MENPWKKTRRKGTSNGQIKEKRGQDTKGRKQTDGATRINY